MDGFVVILGLFLTILIVILVYNNYSNEREQFSLCNEKPGLLKRFFNFLDSLFYNPNPTRASDNKNNSFTVPVDERNNLMRNEGDNYFWSWQ